MNAMWDGYVWGTAVVLLSLAGLHLAWGHGSTWPAATRAAQARLIAGAPEFPSLAACYVVAILLCGATGLLVLTRIATPNSAGRLAVLVNVGVWVVAVALAGRGLVGFLMPLSEQAKTSPPEFIRWNARLYSPLCLVLAGGAVAAALT